MILCFSISVLFLLSCVNACVSTLVKNPNVVILLIDDMGWSDVGFHGSQHLSTPNIDTLAADSIILNRYYTQPLCTPSRGALLTGIRPIHSGTQNYVLLSQQPTGLPIDQKIFPQYLKDYGYSTHAFGKWHLGFFRKEYTPTQRGFDSFEGFWTAYNDYFNHSTAERGQIGFDFRKNFDLIHDAEGNYTTEYLTNKAIKLINNHNISDPLFLYMAYPNVHSGNNYDPLQAPQELIKKFHYIKNESRRIFAANVYSLDQSIGKIFKTFSDKQMLENSIFVFISDNGGAISGFMENEASNYPLKGSKGSLWEGGVRVPAFIWSPLLKNNKYVFKQTIHVTDILPTILEVIDRKSLSKLKGKINGISVWNSLSERKNISRNEILLNIDPVWNMSAIIVNDWKLIQGKVEESVDNNTDIYSSDYESPDSVNTNIVNDRLDSVVFKVLERLERNPDFSIFSKTSVNCRIESQNTSKSCDSNDLCLYNLNSDPCEYTNIAEIYPHIVNKLWAKILDYNKTSVTPLFTIPIDPNARPIYHNNSWDIWLK